MTSHAQLTGVLPKDRLLGDLREDGPPRTTPATCRSLYHFTFSRPNLSGGSQSPSNTVNTGSSHPPLRPTIASTAARAFSPRTPHRLPCLEKMVRATAAVAAVAGLSLAMVAGQEDGFRVYAPSKGMAAIADRWGAEGFADWTIVFS